MKTWQVLLHRQINACTFDLIQVLYKSRSLCMLFLFSVRFIRPSRKGETFLNPQNGPIIKNFACISSDFFDFFLF